MTNETAPIRVPATALFNRLTGEFVTVTSVPFDESNHSNEYYVGRAVDFKFGLQPDKIVGNLIVTKAGTFEDNFKVVPFEEQIETVTEAQMDAMAAEKITSKYPITKQINLLGAAVMTLAKEVGVEDSPAIDELNEMLEYIKYCLQVNKTKKEHYANDPDINYESNEDFAARLARTLEGGIHEELGPRPITGGRVF